MTQTIQETEGSEIGEARDGETNVYSNYTRGGFSLGKELVEHGPVVID